jgi:hypothetical protein
VSDDQADVEAALGAGRLSCAGGSCLAPWGHGRGRWLRGPGAQRRWQRPRRARCAACGATTVLLADWSLPRRRDTIEVIGAGLLAHAHGAEHRPIAQRLGSPRAPCAGGYDAPGPSGYACWPASWLTTSILSSLRSARPALPSVTQLRLSARQRPRSDDASAMTGRHGQRSSASPAAGFSRPVGRDRAYFGASAPAFTPSSMNTRSRRSPPPNVSASSPSIVSANKANQPLEQRPR